MKKDRGFGKSELSPTPWHSVSLPSDCQTFMNIPLVEERSLMNLAYFFQGGNPALTMVWELSQ